jgi:hypothetical protein
MFLKIDNKKLNEHLTNWKTFLENKTGKPVTMTRAIGVAFENQWWNEFDNAKFVRKQRRKKEYVIKL